MLSFFTFFALFDTSFKKAGLFNAVGFPAEGHGTRVSLVVVTHVLCSALPPHKKAQEATNAAQTSTEAVQYTKGAPKSRATPHLASQHNRSSAGAVQV